VGVGVGVGMRMGSSLMRSALFVGGKGHDYEVGAAR
jgi:hypothetical protein